MAAVGGAGVVVGGGGAGGINLFKSKVQTELAELIFGKANLELLKKMKIDVRDIYETSGTDTQCNNTVGHTDINTPCWICGLPIWYGYDGIPLSDKLTGVTVVDSFPAITIGTPQAVAIIEENKQNKRYIYDIVERGQCEHILPILHAQMFTGLYTAIEAKAIEDGKLLNAYNRPYNLDKWIKNLAEIEYSWSHETCNLIKNDDVYITWGDFKQEGINHKGYIPDTRKIASLLNNIFDKDVNYPSTPYFRMMLPNTYAEREAFIKDRTNDMANRMQFVANRMNRIDKEGPATELTMLAGVASLYLPSEKKAIKMLGGTVVYDVKITKPNVMISLINKTLESTLSTFTGGKGLFYSYMTPAKKFEILNNCTTIYTFLQTLPTTNRDIQSIVDKVYSTMVAYENMRALFELWGSKDIGRLKEKIQPLLISLKDTLANAEEVAKLLLKGAKGEEAGGGGAGEEAGGGGAGEEAGGAEAGGEEGEGVNLGNLGGIKKFAGILAELRKKKPTIRIPKEYLHKMRNNRNRSRSPVGYRYGRGGVDPRNVATGYYKEPEETVTGYGIDDRDRINGYRRNGDRGYGGYGRGRGYGGVDPRNAATGYGRDSRYGGYRKTRRIRHNKRKTRKQN